MCVPSITTFFSFYVAVASNSSKNITFVATVKITVIIVHRIMFLRVRGNRVHTEEKPRLQGKACALRGEEKRQVCGNRLLA